MGEFSHYSDEAVPRMVDVSGKVSSLRRACASGFVKMSDATIDLIEKRLLPKGNVFEVAKIAGISAAKQTAHLIPLCHPLLISFIDVTIRVHRERGGVSVGSEVKVEGKTGAEMEALTAVAAASLTVYDMCKAVDKGMVIDEIRLIEKSGGKSDYRYDGESPEK